MYQASITTFFTKYILSSFSHLRASVKSILTKRKPRPTHTVTMQVNTTPMYQGSYLSQPFDTSAEYPDFVDEFQNCEIGKVRIAEIPSHIKEKHLKIWKDIENVDFLTTPLSGSIKIAQMLYILRPHVNIQPGGSQQKADMHHAFIRLVELWVGFEGVLEKWAKKEIGVDADAADGLSRLGEVRFRPELMRFGEALQEYGTLGLPKEIEEFVTTSMKLAQQIEVWLAVRNAW